jgi:hypothetical protein
VQFGGIQIAAECKPGCTRWSGESELADGKSIVSQPRTSAAKSGEFVKTWRGAAPRPATGTEITITKLVIILD